MDWQAYQLYFCLILAGLQLMLILGFFLLRSELNYLKARMRRLLETGQEMDLASALERFKDVKEVKEAIERLEEVLADINTELARCFSRVGMVRFNAFQEGSNDLSFALALLNQEGEGFILTSIYAREETRVFLKPVQKGRPLIRLSQEEEQALAQALGLGTEGQII